MISNRSHDGAADRLTVTARTRAFGAGRRDLVSATPRAGFKSGVPRMNKDTLLSLHNRETASSDDRTRGAQNMYPHCGVLRQEESVDAAVCILHVTHVARWHVLARCLVGPAARVECCSSQAKPPTATLVRRYTCGSDVLRPLLCTPHLVPPSRVGATCIMGLSARARRGCRGAADGGRRQSRALPWT